jgi:hypothetical protein
MGLYEQLKEILPQLTDEDFHPVLGTIALQDDLDGQGAYIKKWDYPTSIPEGFKLGK